MKIQELSNQESLDISKLHITTKLKGRHLIYIEKAFPKIGDVEKGLRLLAILLLESMGSDAPSFEELADQSIESLTPLLKEINPDA